MAALALALLGMPLSGAAQSASPPPPSALDAPLFYQLLIGELRLVDGDPNQAYEVVMDAARRTRDDQLYRRAAEIALQARQADQALATARAWRAARPESPEALRLEVQVLLAVDRSAEAVEPLRALVRLAPAAERSNLILSLPGSLARRGSISRGAAELLDTVLAPFAEQGELMQAVRVASAQAWSEAGNVDRAWSLAEQAHRTDPGSVPATMLALALMPKRPQAEQWVRAHLERADAETSTRLAYARSLMGAQRHADALRELSLVLQAEPGKAANWLTQGALQLELRQPQAAEASLQRFLQLSEAEKSAQQAAQQAAEQGDRAAAGAAAEAARASGTRTTSDEDDDDDGPAAGHSASSQREDALLDAYLLLARAAELRGDRAAAEAWLAKVDDPRRVIEVQTRRATLLAQQGRVAEARQMIQRAPERTAEDARAKLLAEAAMLRDVKRWNDAYGLLRDALQKQPDDVELIYEQSMLAEKLHRVDESERLLRRVIALKPDHAHAYNALGYSLADRGQRLPEARDLIAKALELTPGDPFITDSLGWVEFRLGNRDAALRLLRTAWNARPDPEIGAHLGEVLWAAGQQDEARKAWREAQALDAQNETLRETLKRLKVRP